MSTTIFCSFDQQDVADLAVGQLRNTIHGIKSIHYIQGHNTQRHTSTNSFDNSSIGGFFAVTDDWAFTSAIGVPSQPITVKIICEDSCRRQIMSKLVNMHAYKIVATP